MKKFRYNYFQIQPTFIILSTAIKWATFKIIFEFNKTKKIYII